MDLAEKKERICWADPFVRIFADGARSMYKIQRGEVLALPERIYERSIRNVINLLFNPSNYDSGNAAGPGWLWICLRLAAFIILLSGAPLLSNAKTTGTEGGEVTRATLEHGLRVVIVRNPLAPVPTTVISYLVGSNEAPPGFPGMAHAREHMMFRCSPELSADQLSAIAAGMGGNFDAQTQQTVTQYFFTVPVQYLDVALHVEAARMAGVLDTEALWNQERGAIEQEVAQDLSNPQYVFYTHLLEKMFDGTPYAHDVLGTRYSFDRTTGAMLQKFYDACYASNNAILVITGAVEPKAVLAQVKSMFEKIPAKELTERPAVKLKPIKPATLNQTTDLPYGIGAAGGYGAGYRRAAKGELRKIAIVKASAYA